MNFVKFLRARFHIEHLCWLLLSVVYITLLLRFLYSVTRIIELLILPSNISAIYSRVHNCSKQINLKKHFLSKQSPEVFIYIRKFINFLFRRTLRVALFYVFRLFKMNGDIMFSLFKRWYYLTRSLITFVGKVNKSMSYCLLYFQNLQKALEGLFSTNKWVASSLTL